jgi:pilus assembly protein CpaC
MKRPMTRLAAVALAALSLAAAGPVMPDVAQAQTRAALPMGAGAQLINLPRGSSMAIDLPSDARDVIVPNPVVAEAMLHSPRRITIIGLQPGETDAVVLDAAGRTILSLRVRVDAGVSALQDTLGRVMPGSEVRAEAVNDSIILTGPVNSPGEADRASQVARAFVSAPEKVINMMTISGSDQVMVKARVIEVQRTAIKQLGLDVDAVLNTVGDGLSFAQSATFAVSGSQLGGGILNYLDQSGDGNSLDTSIRAFERAGLVRILAEPNLTSVNGENAEFLAGGEFPVPTGRDVDSSTGQVTVGIEFKPFGVRLAFRPIVLSQGRISLQLSTEVSELTQEGAFTLGGTADDALVIPALKVRRASSTVELPSGGSMMIAGLLREDTRQNIDQLPGIGSLPVLGALFRSRDYLSGETELVIIIEAYIVSPTSPGRLQTPADGLIIANDAQTILFGQLDQQYRPAGGATTTASAGWTGPVGYVIE